LNMNINFPWKSQLNNGGMIVDIQIVNNVLYQIHISLSTSIKNIGLGYKIYEAMIYDLGHLYSGKGRMLNKEEVPRIWEKLKSNPNFETFSTSLGNISMIKNNPNKEELLKAMNL